MATFRDLLKFIIRMPMFVEYVADDTVGFMVSCIVMVWFTVSAIRLPDVSCIAPASISSLGVIMAFTVPVFVPFRVNVM